MTIKGITTSTPVDANSKKKVRLGEVRQKRADAKLKRKLERETGGKPKSKTKTTPKSKVGHKPDVQEIKAASKIKTST